MRKNILILNGSPRQGNSRLLADAFAQGAGETGHTITMFDAARKRIGGCIACDMCWKKERACAVNDDFQILAPLLEKADVLVLAFPLYWSSMPSQLKAPIDRLFAYASDEHRKDICISASVLLVCGECSSLEDFNNAVSIYRGIAEYMGWKLSGEILVPNVKEAGSVCGTDALEHARMLGSMI